MKINRKGFTLLETLISLTLFLLLMAIILKTTSLNKSIFYKLKNEEENLEFGFSALEKIRIDSLKAGELLEGPLKLGILKCLETTKGTLIIKYGEENTFLLKDVYAGSRKLEIQNSSKFKKKRKIVINTTEYGEVAKSTKIDGSSIILERPLYFSYKKEKTEIILLKEICYFLDSSSNILRRKVNNSSAQPLIEDINKFKADYIEEKNLLLIHFLLQKVTERVFDTTVFPKNLALIKRRSNE